MDGVSNSQMPARKKYIQLSFEKSWGGGRKKAEETLSQEGTFNLEGLSKR